MGITITINTDDTKKICRKCKHYNVGMSQGGFVDETCTLNYSLIKGDTENKNCFKERK